MSVCVNVVLNLPISEWNRSVSCDESKATYPDHLTALVVRDQLIRRYGVPMLVYKCLGGCSKWHLTTKPRSGRKIKAWNHIDTAKGYEYYWALVREAQEDMTETIKPGEEYL